MINIVLRKNKQWLIWFCDNNLFDHQRQAISLKKLRLVRHYLIFNIIFTCWAWLPIRGRKTIILPYLLFFSYLYLPQFKGGGSPLKISETVSPPIQWHIKTQFKISTITWIAHHQSKDNCLMSSHWKLQLNGWKWIMAKKVYQNMGMQYARD